MLSALNDAGADYLVVGAYALAAMGNPRATGDIDLWVRPDPDNAARVWQALIAFNAPRGAISVADFATPDVVFQIGVAPNRIDILTSIDGVQFETAWQRRCITALGGISVPVISKTDLIDNKRASGRTKDAADVEWLENHQFDDVNR